MSEEEEAGLPRRCAARNDDGGEDPLSRRGKPIERMQAGKHRPLQIARTGGRKLFGEAAQGEFLEWFAATCNLSWSAEMAGFSYKTVLRHRMNDERFREGFDRAVEQGYARLEAKRLETKRTQPKIGIEGDWDAPEMDEMAPERMDAILRERGRLAAGGAPARKQGRRPHIASNAEVREALEKRLKAFYARERARLGKGAAAEEADEQEFNPVIASGAKQSSAGSDASAEAGLPRRSAPRNDDLSQ